jgi:peptide chain release factor subunit 1
MSELTLAKSQVPKLVVEKATHFYSCQLATSNSVKQHKLRKRIALLSDKEGLGREFISLFIPRKTPIDEVIAILKKESDIPTKESESISERLHSALKNVILRLKQVKEIPENGLALFSGVFQANVSEKEVLNLEEIIPPEPLTTYFYEVDDHFLLEPLREMLRDQKNVGILALDSKQATFGLSNNGRLEVTENISSGISGKSGKGGSSQRRYERERDASITNFFHRIAEHANTQFTKRKVNILMVGGPGPTKNDFLKGEYLHYELNNMLLNIVDTQSAGKEALKEIIDKSSETLKNMCGPEEKKIVQHLMTELNKQSGLATYGLESVLGALKNGKVQIAIVTDTTDIIENVAICKRCGLSKIKIANKKIQTMQEMIESPCKKCGGVSYTTIEKDIVDVLEDMASKTNASVEVISSASEEKASLTALGGFAALLRYNSG